MDTNNEEKQVEKKPFITRELAPHRHSSIRVCKTCGKFYYISDDDLMYFINKYNTIPLKCENCRKKSRENSNIENIVEE